MFSFGGISYADIHLEQPCHACNRPTFYTVDSESTCLGGGVAWGRSCLSLVVVIYNELITMPGVNLRCVVEGQGQ